MATHLLALTIALGMLCFTTSSASPVYGRGSKVVVDVEDPLGDGSYPKAYKGGYKEMNAGYPQGDSWYQQVDGGFPQLDRGYQQGDARYPQEDGEYQQGDEGYQTFILPQAFTRISRWDTNVFYNNFQLYSF